MISALHLFAVKLAIRERHSPMRAGVAQRKRSPGRVAPQYERKFQQRLSNQLRTLYASAGRCPVPKAKEHQGIGALLLRRFQFSHERSKAAYYSYPIGEKNPVQTGSGSRHVSWEIRIRGRKLLRPSDPARHLHYDKQGHDRTGGNCESGKSLEEECVGEQHQVNELSASRFEGGKSQAHNEPEIADDQEYRNNRADGKG